MMQSINSTGSSAGDNGHDRDLSMPLGVDADGIGGDSFDPLAGAEAGKKGRAGMILLGGVVLVAVAGLVSMRTFARATAAAVTNQEVRKTVDAFVAAVTGEEERNGGDSTSGLLASNTKALVVLQEPYTERQVPLRDVQRNPFVLFDRPVTASVEPLPADTAGQQRAEATRRIEAAGTSLILTSCLMGSSPLANINNKIVREGETIEVEGTTVVFRVAEIRGDSAKLISEVPHLGLEVPVVIRIER